jgi:hypothetical protein
VCAVTCDVLGDVSGDTGFVSLSQLNELLIA